MITESLLPARPLALMPQEARLLRRTDQPCPARTQIIVRRLVIVRAPRWRYRLLPHIGIAMLLTGVSFLGGVIAARPGSVPVRDPAPRYSVQVALPPATSPAEASEMLAPPRWQHTQATGSPPAEAVPAPIVASGLSDQPERRADGLSASAEAALLVALKSGEAQDWAGAEGRRGVVVVGSPYVRGGQDCRDFSIFAPGGPVRSGARCGGTSSFGGQSRAGDDRIVFIEPPAGPAPARAEDADSR